MKTVEQAREALVAEFGYVRTGRIEALIGAKIAAARKPLPPYDGWRVGQDATPEDTAKGGGREAVDDLIGFAITEALGERCATHDPDCLTCKAWAQYDAENRNIAEMVRQSLDKDRRIASLESTLAEKDQRIAELERQVDGLVKAAKRILPYLDWTIGEESPAHHPTMPSAVAAFKASLRALSPVQEEAGA